MKLIIMGAPRTLKNTPQAVLGRSASGKGQPCPYCKRPISQRVFPSKAWREWVKDATIEVDGVKLVKSGNLLLLWTTPARPWVPISQPVNCAAVFWRDADRGDLVGLMQGVADLLQERGVVEDDKWIHGWDGTRLALAYAGRPRVELTLSAI